mmetsp:Transcript_8439/g.38401  ORF Transcript_8439/g.38401 Transcript_8439/m.38401 type:complete len:259 (+) Transcript_8439:3223-3999(+)
MGRPETIKRRRRTTPAALELHLLSSVLGAGAAHTAHGGTASAANELGVAPATPGLPRARVRGGSAFTSAAEINITAARTPVIVEPLQRQLTRPTFPLTPGSQLGDTTLRQKPPSSASHHRVTQRQHRRKLAVKRPVPHDWKLRRPDLLLIAPRRAAERTAQVVEGYRGPGPTRADLIGRALPVHDVTAAQQYGGRGANRFGVANWTRIVAAGKIQIPSLLPTPRGASGLALEAGQALRLAPYTPARVTAGKCLGARAL